VLSPNEYVSDELANSRGQPHSERK
jgi:hypothetical protein